MIKKIFLYALLSLFISGCKKNEKTIILDKRSFSFVNLNQTFPIINFESVFNTNDTLGLALKQSMPSDSQKIYLRSIIIDYSKRNIICHSLGWSPTFSFKFDSINRLQSQKISSCFTWNISYRYLDTLGCIYRFSTAEKSHENKSDTTIFKLDTYGRVTQVDGTDYEDLHKVTYSKKVYYSALHSIPDSINSLYYRNNSVSKHRKELFYQNNGKIDSIQIEDSEVYNSYSGKLIFTNYFNSQEMFIGFKNLYPKSKNKTFYVEKIRH